MKDFIGKIVKADKETYKNEITAAQNGMEKFVKDVNAASEEQRKTDEAIYNKNNRNTTK